MKQFALKEGVADSFVDAAVAVPPDGETLSVAQRLKDGKGVIRTEDPHEIEALSGLDVLKEVSDSEAAAIRKAAPSGGKGK